MKKVSPQLRLDNNIMHMQRKPILSFIKKFGRPIFTTAELSAVSGKSPSATVQALNHLQEQGVIFKVYRGVWAEVGDRPLSPYSIIPFLFPRGQAYVSFTSALHLYGIIEQIPQVITLASTGHTRKITTKLGDFSVHQISPAFFDGFDWYKQEGDFLIAEPEKALADCLYLAGHKKKQFAHFPELRFPQNFSLKRVENWIKKIPRRGVSSYAERRLALLKKEAIFPIRVKK